MWFSPGVAEVAVHWTVAPGGLHRRAGRKECLGDEATVKLVQLLLGQHQAVSLS